MVTPCSHKCCHVKLLSHVLPSYWLPFSSLIFEGEATSSDSAVPWTGRVGQDYNISNSWDPNSWIDPISNRAFEIQEIRCNGFKLTKHIKPPFYWDHFAISPWPWPQVNFLTRKIGSWSDWAGCRWSKHHHHHHPRDGKLQTYMTTYPSTLPHCGSKSKSVIAISSRWNPLKA